MIQLIIIDNASKDDSVSRIEDWLDQQEDTNVQFISNPFNIGICAALNQGLALTEGKYYQMISCDDLLEPDKFEKQVNLFEQSSDSLAFIYGNEKLIDENGDLIQKENFFTSQGWNHNDDLPAGRIQEQLLNSYFLRAPTILYKTACVIDIGGYDEKIPFEDYQMNIRLLSKYSCKGMVDMLCSYRVLSNSFYNTSSNSTIESNYLKTMKYVYGDTFYQNWIILLRFMYFDNSIHVLIIKKIILVSLNRIAKKYKRFLG